MRLYAARRDLDQQHLRDSDVIETADLRAGAIP
jgi:hypothetical protein